MMKKIKFSFAAEKKLWVGDGFYVHPLLRPQEGLYQFTSPFILMDYSPPFEFGKTSKRRGVGEHPHRGFETVTFAFKGEVEHRDSSGGGGLIRPGDVQWMTAGEGVVHDEFHSESFSKKGGLFEMVQLWVNLPKKHKMTKPKYQSISDNIIPKLVLNGKTQLRVIAGKLLSTEGPASTFSTINIYDITCSSEDTIELSLDDGSNTILLVRDGEIMLEGNVFEKNTLVVFEQAGQKLKFKATKNFKGLLLNGMPINEPIFSYGPFVMNTEEEIEKALSDYEKGKMGNLN